MPNDEDDDNDLVVDDEVTETLQKMVADGLLEVIGGTPEDPKYQLTELGNKLANNNMN